MLAKHDGPANDCELFVEPFSGEALRIAVRAEDENAFMAVLAGVGPDLDLL